MEQQNFTRISTADLGVELDWVVATEYSELSYFDNIELQRVVYTEMASQLLISFPRGQTQSTP